MTTFSPGDIVDIVQRVDGARVIQAGVSYITIDHPNDGPVECINLDDPAVTITRRAPQPQADLTAAYQELCDAVKEWQDAEAVKLTRTMTNLAEIIRSKTAAPVPAPVPADAEAVR